jgi:hypothetical protein
VNTRRHLATWVPRCGRQISATTGRNIDVAVFYPEDDAYLIDRQTTVMHYEVARTL